jgi:hypothetical protein
MKNEFSSSADCNPKINEQSNVAWLATNYDWRSVFSAACGHSQGGCYWSGTPMAVPPGSRCLEIPFNIEDVVEVIASEDGEHDGDNWLGVFRLRDGRFGMVSAGCDYSGWD